MSARRPAAAARALELALALVSPVAIAQSRENPFGSSAHMGPESPQHFAAEIRFAPFSPNVDSDPALGGKTPYQDAFGSAPRLMLSAELDWQALRIPHVGTIGPGVGAGYTSIGRPALFATPHQPGGQLVSGEDTTLQIFPFYGVAVLRADALWRELGVPVVPYAKVGLGYALWRASNTIGTSRTDGVSGEGHSIGTHFALGVGLNLNPFDEYAAKTFDDSLGVNSSYLFGEWTYEDLSGLGLQSHPLRVGGTSWTFGLAFEF